MDSHRGFYFPPPASKDRAVKRASFCKLSFSSLSDSYVFVKWKKYNILPSFLQIHIVESTIHHSLMRTVPPFFQERSCILHFPFWRNFSILSFYKRTFRFTPAIPTGFHSSEPKAHFPYTLSIEALIPAGITHSVFVPRLPVMVSLFHIPLAK